MDLDWIEDFLALNSVGVFARAAEARNISQPAFTRRIKNLEHWAGTPLFDRGVHPVVLTPAGESFKPTAYEMIKMLKTARSEAKGLAVKSGQVLEFAALHTLAISFFPKWIWHLEKSLGPINAKVNAENFSGCVESVLSGSSDLMLGYHHPSVPSAIDEQRYPSLKIAEEMLIAVSAANHDGQPEFQLLEDTRFPLLSYTPDSFLGHMTGLLLERSNLTQYADFRYENSMSEALKSACLQGFGIAWLPTSSILDELASGQLIRVSSDNQQAKLAIRLHRSIERSRSELERFWSFVSSDNVARPVV